jgi:hypothetical protein
MTVAELIVELGKLPQNLPVVVGGGIEPQEIGEIFLIQSEAAYRSPEGAELRGPTVRVA